MSGNALNFKVSVDAKEVNDLNKSLDLLRQNFLGLDKDAKASMSGVDKSLSNYNKAVAQSAKVSKDAFSGNKKFYEVIRHEVRTVEAAEKKIRALEAAKKKLNTTSKHYATNLRAINAQIAKTNLFLSQNAAVNKNASVASRNAASSIERQNKALSKQGDFFSRNTSLAQQFQNQMIGFTSIYAMERMLSTLIKIRGEFEIQNVALSAMLQNKALADKMFLQVQDLALQSPFKILDLNKSLKQLKAYRIENENLVGTLGMLGDISAGLGVGMDRLILAFGQIKATGWLRGTELRQLTEAGINILDPLAKKFQELGEVGTTTADVMKKIEERMVSFDMVNEVFEDLTKKGSIFYEQQILQSETLQGKVSILTDALHKMLNEIGQANDSTLKGGVDMLIDLFSNADKLRDIIISLIFAFGTYRVSMALINGEGTKMVRNIKAMTVSMERYGFGVKRMIAAEKRLALAKKGVSIADMELNALRKSGLATSMQMEAAQKKQVLATHELAAAQRTAATSAKALKVAMGALLIALEVIALVTIKLFHDRKQLIEQAQKYREGTEKEIFALRELENLLKSNTSTTNERNKALKDAIDLNPNIVGGLNEQGEATKQLTDSINQQIQALKDRARIQSIYGADYLDQQKKVDKAESDLAKKRAKADEQLLALMRSLEASPSPEAGTLRQGIMSVFTDESLDAGQQMLAISKEINKVLKDTGVSDDVRELLSGIGSFTGGYSGNEQFNFDVDFLRVASRQQRVLEKQAPLEAKIKEIFESYSLFAEGAASRMQKDAADRGEEVAGIYTESFAKEFGSRVESDVLFGKDVVDYISENIFPTAWESDQERMVKEYFDFYEKEVIKGSDEWQRALEKDSRARDFSLNKFLVETYGIGDLEVLRKETRIWAKTVKDMISNAQEGIADFRTDEKGTGLGITQPMMTQNIEAYREYIAEVVDDTKKAMKNLSKAAQNDPVVQKELNKLYNERLKTFQSIKTYLGVFDDDKKKNRQLTDYTLGLDKLLKALTAFKRETETFSKELDYTLGLGKGKDPSELLQSEKLSFETAEKALYESVKKTFAGTYFKGVYDSFKAGAGEYASMSGETKSLADKITGDISKIFTESLTGNTSKEEVKKAVQSYYEEVYNGLGTSGLDAAQMKKFKEQLELTKQPIIDALLGDAISNKDFNDLVKKMDKLIARPEDKTGMGQSMGLLMDMSDYDKSVKALKQHYLDINEVQKISDPEERAKKEKEITDDVERRVKAYKDIKEQILPGIAKSFIDDAFGLQNLTQSNLSDASLTKLFKMAREFKSLAKTDWNFGKLLGMEGTDLEEFNKINQQIRETLSGSGEGWDFTDALGVMSSDMTTLSEDQIKLYDKLKQVTDNLTPEQIALIKKLYTELKRLQGEAQEDVKYEIVDTIADIGSKIGESFSKVNDEMTKLIGEWVSLTSKAIGDIINGEGIEKASGIISLAVQIGNEIKGVWSSIKTESADAQIKINKGLASQISMETTINNIRKERLELERASSAFYEPTTIQDVQFYSDQARISLGELDNSMNALLNNAVFSAEGVGDRKLFGVDLGGDANVGTKTEGYSFTMADLMGGGEEFQGAPVGLGMGDRSGITSWDDPDIAASFLDPIGIFGGGSSARAQEDAYKQVSDAFNVALSSMGKTAVDMAQFSSEEWLDFYTLLESSGNITDEATLAMLASGTEALEAYNQAMEGLRQTISDLAGTIYTDLKDSLVQAFMDSSSAADELRKSLQGVLESLVSEIAFQATFGTLFDSLQEDLENSLQMGNPAEASAAVFQKFFEDANYLAPTFDAMLSNAQLMAEQFNFELFQDSVDELGQLQQGIKGMSENTADILVGQFNSIRDAVWRIYSAVSVSQDVLNMNQAINQNLLELMEIKNNTGATAAATAKTLSLLEKLTTMGSGTKLNI